MHAGNQPRRPGTSRERVGFVGLGNMGSALAANLVDAGFDVVTHDLRGPERSPRGATFAGSLTELSQRTKTVVLSLPDGAAGEQVAAQLAGAAGCSVTHVVDTSTIGMHYAQQLSSLLAESGISYVDAPVSGGVAGARARTLAVMYAGDPDACAHVAPVLAGLSERRYCVGERAGKAQALKLANNFLSAVALVATSEAVAFGEAAGLDMQTMLNVLSNSSGHNTATSEKFPQHVLTGRYASGFANTLMAKDLRLYLQAVQDFGAPALLGTTTTSVWERFASAEPGVDFTRIYPFVSAADGITKRVY